MKNWEIRRLGEICELFAGGDVPKDDFSKFQTEDKQVPIYANGEKNDGLYGYTSVGKITKPSITVSARGTIGFSVKRLESFYPIVRLITVTPKDLQILDLTFLDYAIKGIDFKHSGSSIPQLTIPMIKDYEIPIPPLQGQQRIVAILDEAFIAIAKAKANAQQNLQNAKELFESYLQNTFSQNYRLKRLTENTDATSKAPVKTESSDKIRDADNEDVWEEKKLREVCELSAGGDVPKDDFSVFKTDDKQVPIYANGEKNDGLYGYTSIGKITRPSITVSARGTIGFSVKRLESFYPIVRLITITPKDLQVLDLTYLDYTIKRIDFKHSGSSIPQLTIPMIQDYEIPILTLDAQQTIVKKLDALSAETKKLETIYQQKINDLEELKKSILQKAFSGELKTKEKIAV